MRQLIPWLNLETGRFLSETIVRLVLAAVLGGIIGLERETKRKPAGLRTNMFICFGAAMFTILSFRLAEQYTGDHTRIAAQIIPGIGFIGAGSILHSRGSVTGLTTAATIFVVASIGMAVGAGLYLPAIFATVLIVLALYVLGWMETRFSLKAFVVSYQAVGPDAEAIISDVNHILDEEHHVMQTVQVGRANHEFRVQFTVDATRSEHDDLMQRFRQCGSIARVESEAVSERE
ncbi:MAG TPA: MgtC/SapB family protein [Terriglobales bacterium]|jgi:putative Mg2+ transporter-C (MgtC) family protein|nr:MgtC/SapB family protein [Terriglobales bacterium]